MAVLKVAASATMIAVTWFAASFAAFVTTEAISVEPVSTFLSPKLTLPASNAAALDIAVVN